jgi:hypothetical protein
VFKNILTPKQRKTWVTEIYPNSPKPTEYAKTNAQEGFCESYALGLINRIM